MEQNQWTGIVPYCLQEKGNGYAKPREFSFEEGIANIGSEGRIAASNKTVSIAFAQDKNWARYFSDGRVSAFWTGTVTAHGRPGRKLKNEIEKSQLLGPYIQAVDETTNYRWIFPISQEFLEIWGEKKDILCVAEHPNYVLEIDGTNRIVHAKEMDTVIAFPRKNNFYKGDSKHDIPQGKPLSLRKAKKEGHLILWRDERGDDNYVKRVGPVTRYDGRYFEDRLVSLRIPPSTSLPFVVEARESDYANSDIKRVPHTSLSGIFIIR